MVDYHIIIEFINEDGCWGIPEMPRLLRVVQREVDFELLAQGAAEVSHGKVKMMTLSL